MSTTISPSDKVVIKTALGKDVEIYAATATRIYFTGMRLDRWNNQGQEGALVLLKDRGLGGLFFKLVSLNLKKVIWEHEVYFDFDYRQDSNFFHSFESDNNQQIGFLFVNEQEAFDFAQVVIQKSAILQLSSGKSHSSTKSPSIKDYSSITSGDLEEKSNSSGFFNLFRRTKHKKKSIGNELTADDIGDPTDFRHLAHIGFNSATGSFDIQNIPNEWKEIFKKAGVTKEQLENKETAGFIANFVKNTQASEPSAAIQTLTESPQKVKRVPPQPPAKTIKGPPPQPPSKTKNIPSALSTPSILSTSKVPTPPEFSDQSRPTPQADDSARAAYPVDDSRALLLNSIRKADHGALRRVERSKSSNSFSDAQSSDPGDMMANMLAKALAERNRKLAHSDSDDNGKDDDEW